MNTKLKSYLSDIFVSGVSLLIMLGGIYLVAIIAYCIHKYGHIEASYFVEHSVVDFIQMFGKIVFGIFIFICIIRLFIPYQKTPEKNTFGM